MYTGNIYKAGHSVTIPGYTQYSNNVYLAGSPVNIPGYTAYSANLYTGGTQITIPGYTAYDTSLYTDGGDETIPGYTWVGDSYRVIESDFYYVENIGRVYKAGSTVSRIGNKVGNLYYYASEGGWMPVKEYPNDVHRVGTSVTTVGTSYSTAYALAEGTSNYTLIEGVPYYNNDLYVEDPSESRTVHKRSTNPVSPTLYYRDSSQDQTVTPIGSAPSVTLYYRDSDHDQTVTPIGNAPPYTMYYRNEDHDSYVTALGSQVTFNHADITTQQITGLTATS